MGYRLSKADGEKLFGMWAKRYDIFAPKRMEGEGCFSDTDIIRYGRVISPDQIVWDQKSDYPFKEVLLAINETLFYFTEGQARVPEGPKKDRLIFLRSCDLHAVKRLDEIYLRNGFEDYYYKRVRERTKFILMGCAVTCDSGFCISMGTSQSENYDAYIKAGEDEMLLDVKDSDLEMELAGKMPENTGEDDATVAAETVLVTPEFPKENKEQVALPKKLSNASFTNEIWKEYGSRCIGCGRCNFVCPTCTCFTMQDIFYRDNPRTGERRRVWASCQIDGYTDMAGGHSYRQNQGDRMRFKVMHKIYDFEKRFGYIMCVGCGRCDNVCPEYISYSNCINRLAKEEKADEE